jgi:transposase-like protein
MGRKRKSHAAEFKARVALAALKGDKTTNEVASAYGVHPALVNEWRRQLLANAAAAFAGAAAAPVDVEQVQAPLFEKIGRLEMELDWLKKKAARLG